MTKLIADEQRAKLLANGQESIENSRFDPLPVANPAADLYNEDRVARADGLDRLPKDYAGMPPASKPAPPVLSPPLPGRPWVVGHGEGTAAGGGEGGAGRRSGGSRAVGGRGGDAIFGVLPTQWRWRCCQAGGCPRKIDASERRRGVRGDRASAAVQSLGRDEPCRGFAG